MDPPILEHPNEHGQAIEAVAHHVALFDHPPGTVAGDRGVHSPETEAILKEAGVKRVAIPASGKLSEERNALEHTRPWRRGYRWRAGIEGRIASLRRDYGWRMCRYHGQDGMERRLGLGVIASNLLHLAQATRAASRCLCSCMVPFSLGTSQASACLSQVWSSENENYPWTTFERCLLPTP